MSIKKNLTKVIDLVANRALGGVRGNPLIERSLALQGSIAASQQKAIEKIVCLADIEFSVFSQWGEDGIIEWLVHMNGDMPETFIEFGVENYRESNTRFLLMNRNWRGLIIDGSEDNIAIARGDNISWRHDLTAMAAFITTANINELIQKSGIVGDIGILSIDIDGNDFWVWEAINCIRPHIVVAEYNSAFGDLHTVSVPYSPDFYRGNVHYSNLHYGASISALDHLAISRGYSMLGSNRAGSNVFFIRNDRLARFEGRVADRKARPSRFREGRDIAHHLTFVRGVQRSAVIADLLVADVSTGLIQPLSSYGNLYSERWVAALEK